MTIDFGTARAVDAETFGTPGERTFRLRVIGSTEQSASLWMEKQQFQALNLAFAQMLAQLNYEDNPSPSDLTDFPVDAQHDFRVGRIGLGYDTANRTFVLDAYEIGAPDEDTEATVRVRLTPDHCARLVGQLTDIVSQGRPLCPLCGVSIDPGGHVCIRANGHSRQPIPDEQPGEEGSEQEGL